MRSYCALVLMTALVGTSTVADEGDQKGKYWELTDLETHYIAQVARLRASGYAEMFGGNDEFEQYVRSNTVRAPSNPESGEDNMFGPSLSDIRQPSYLPEGNLHRILRYAAPVWVDEGNTPFLIVFPEECAPLRWQATRVKINGLKADLPQFPLAKVANARGVATPRKTPYILFNVNCGADTAHTSVINAAWEFANDDRPRRGLTLLEGIALLLQYPDAVKCELAMDEDYHEHFAYGHPTFIGSFYGREPANSEDNESIVFVIPKSEHGSLGRGYFTHTQWRDMRPNYVRFMYPSCNVKPWTEPR